MDELRLRAADRQAKSDLLLRLRDEHTTTSRSTVQTINEFSMSGTPPSSSPTPAGTAIQPHPSVSIHTRNNKRRRPNPPEKPHKMLARDRDSRVLRRHRLRISKLRRPHHSVRCSRCIWISRILRLKVRLGGMIWRETYWPEGDRGCLYYQFKNLSPRLTIAQKPYGRHRAGHSTQRGRWDPIQHPPELA